jgi:hypothetical protein
MLKKSRKTQTDLSQAIALRFAEREKGAPKHNAAQLSVLAVIALNGVQEVAL